MTPLVRTDTIVGTIGSIAPSPQLPSSASAEAQAAHFAALHADAHRAKAWCLRIYAEFLAKSAIYEVNIPDDLSALVTSQIGFLKTYEPTPLDASGQPQIDLTTTEDPQPPPFALSMIFAATQLTILNLMETDSFRRFILTAEFRSMLAAADEAEAARLEMQVDLHGEMAATLHAATQALGGAQLVPPAAAGLPQVTSKDNNSNNNNNNVIAAGAMSVIASPAVRISPPSSVQQAAPSVELLPGAVQSA